MYVGLIFKSRMAGLIMVCFLKQISLAMFLCMFAENRFCCFKMIDRFIFLVILVVNVQAIYLVIWESKKSVATLGKKKVTFHI